MRWIDFDTKEYNKKIVQKIIVYKRITLHIFPMFRTYSLVLAGNIGTDKTINQPKSSVSIFCFFFSLFLVPTNGIHLYAVVPIASIFLFHFLSISPFVPFIASPGIFEHVFVCEGMLNYNSVFGFGKWSTQQLIRNKSWAKIALSTKKKKKKNKKRKENLNEAIRNSRRKKFGEWDKCLLCDIHIKLGDIPNKNEE